MTTQELLNNHLQHLQTLTVVVKVEQVGRVVTFTFERNGKRWTEQFLTILKGE